MGNSKIKAAKRARFQAIIKGIYFSLLASYVTGFGAWIEYFAIRAGIKGDSTEDAVVLAVIGIGMMLLSILVWKEAFKEWKKVKEYKQYLMEHEGDSDAFAENAQGNRGQLLSRGFVALAISIFGGEWLLTLVDRGAPIWFCVMGMLFVILAGSQAIFDLTDAVQLGQKEKIDCAEETKGTFSGKRSKLILLILSGVLAVYNVISFGMVILREMDTKAVFLILLANVALILSVLSEINFKLKTLYRQRQEKSE